jgi:hypothetical protein
MVQLAQDASLSFDRGPGVSGWMVLRVDFVRFRLREISELAFRELVFAAAVEPQQIGTLDGRTLWAFREDFYWCDIGLSADKVQRLVAWRLPTR